MKKKEQFQKATANIELPSIECAGIMHSLEDAVNQLISLDFFIKYCHEEGYSVGQVLSAIQQGSLPMLDHEQRRMHKGDFLEEKNLESYLRNQDVKFFNVTADYFWKNTKPDHQGGWSLSVDKPENCNFLERTVDEIKQANLENREYTKSELKRWNEILKEQGKTRRERAEILYSKEFARGHPKIESLMQRISRLE